MIRTAAPVTTKGNLMTFARRILITAALLVPLMSANAQQKRAMTFVDLMALDRVSEAAISPDGRWVAYTVSTPNLAENRVAQEVWLASTAGGTPPRQLTTGDKDTRPQ